MASFPSSDGTELHELTWSPEGAAKGTVVIVHGYGEHIARYDHVGRALAKAGFVVRGCDLRGHGRSGGARGFIRRFDDYLADVDALVDRAKGDPRPLWLLGHSNGGLIALHWALRHRDRLAGLVLSSPFFKLKLDVPKIKILAGRVFSTLWPGLRLPAGLQGSDVSRDPEIARLYDSDPLNNKSATARWFTETVGAQEEALARAAELDLPCLVLHGSGDKIADHARSEELFQRLASVDKTLRIEPGQYHELFNEIEPDRSRTVDGLVRWLEAHTTPA
ncbi:MAG: alpha/beta hydrolase [Myxococcales bacterium]|nr:alpha/beta hydrolase [Myxococcales bacterium]